MRAALLQLCGTDQPEENLASVQALMREAAGRGATWVLTPEVTNCLSGSRSHQNATLVDEAHDPVLAGLRSEAATLGVWLLIGSLALKTGDADGRFANRSLMIAPDGQIVARYDKIHMFDVDVSESETYRESASYRPGDRAVLAQTDWGPVGLTICYDVRFPHLFRALAKAGAGIITVPSAFSPITGQAHWELLLRARAIETGCFILAPAQTGAHPVSRGRPRQSHGHSLVVAPWGEVLANGGTEPGLVLADLDLTEIVKARARIGSLGHDRPFAGP